MKADTLKLTQIFRKDIRYIVPMFQRPYVWNEEEHWQVLWEDLRQVVEELIKRRSEQDPEPGEALDVPPHFLGAMVLDQLHVPVKKLESREVIDGQQRLTTLQVLLSAVEATAQELEVDDQAALVRKLIYNDEDLVVEPEDRYKIWPIAPDQAAFKDVMNGGPDGDSDHALHECFRFFEETIREWAVEDGSPEDRLEALVTTLWAHVRIVVVDLDHNDEPQMIFETLNARGTPLLAADLIKNFLFREARRKNLAAESLHERYWAPFDADQWRENVRQGRLERPRIDVFIMHWLTMRTRQVVRAQHLFRAFQKYVTGTDYSVEGILQDIAHHADVYSGFSEHTEDRQGIFFRRLEQMDTTTPLPVLLRIFGEEEALESARTRSVEALESWLVRRMLCRLTTKNYNRMMTELLGKLEDSPPSHFDEIVIRFLKDKTVESEYWPSDDELESAMVNKPYWGRINQRRLRMVFRALERGLRGTGYSEEVRFEGTLQIEHILPQDWAHHWPLPGDKPAEVERIEREEAKDKIGNLTVLTKKLNPSISNADWPTKRENIGEHTTLLLNRRLVDGNPERWDESTIKERARELAALAVRVWPGPSAEYW